MSLAMRAFQLSAASDYCWDYLEHIEAPQWVDLSWEASLEGSEGDDPWFYQHHPHHETPLEDLVFVPGRKSKDKARKRFDEDELEFKAEARKTTEKQEEGHGPVWPRVKAKRVQLQPDRTGKQEQKIENHVSPLRPSDSFSAKLLATLMARLRTSEEMQATSNSKDSSLSDSKLANQMKTDSSPAEFDSHSSMLHVRKLRLRASIAAMPLSGTTEVVKKDEDHLKSLAPKGDKENTKSPRRAKVTIPQLDQVKKTKTLHARKSLASLEFGKNLDGSFSVGSGAVAPRRRLSCTSKSPRFRSAGKVIGKPARTSVDRRQSGSKASSSFPRKETELGCKARTGGDDLAALIAKHNSKLQPKPKYEPRLHSTRDIREWERKAGLQYYNLQPVERVKVNQEISELKRSQIS